MASFSRGFGPMIGLLSDDLCGRSTRSTPTMGVYLSKHHSRVGRIHGNRMAVVQISSQRNKTLVCALARNAQTSTISSLFILTVAAPLCTLPTKISSQRYNTLWLLSLKSIVQRMRYQMEAVIQFGRKIYSWYTTVIAQENIIVITSSILLVIQKLLQS